MNIIPKETVMWARTTPTGVVHEPKYPGDAGIDLSISEDTVLPPQSLRSVPCGVRVALPEGVSALVIPRSSSARAGLLVLSTLIDSGYRGPMFVLAYNLTSQSIALQAGMRVAQLLPTLNVPLMVQEVEESQLPESARGSNGFGSSGGGLKQ